MTSSKAFGSSSDCWLCRLSNLGFIGRRGSQVVSVHRCDEYLVKDLKLEGDLGQIVFQRFYLRDYESLLRSMEYADVVINTISTDDDTMNFTMEDANIVGARALARAAKEMGVKKFVQTTCLPASVDSPYRYHRTKVLPSALSRASN